MNQRYSKRASTRTPDNHLEGWRGHLAIDNTVLYYGERRSKSIKEVPRESVRWNGLACNKHVRRHG